MVNNGFEIRNATEADIDQIMEITGSAFVKYKELAGTKQEVAALNETRETVAEDIKNGKEETVDELVSTLQKLMR